MNIDKTIRILTIVAIALAVTFTGGIVLQNLGRGGVPANALLPSAKKDEVALLEITKAGVTTTLTKDGASWAAQSKDLNVAAQADRIGQLMDAVYKLSVERTVASGKDQYANLGIADEAATRLTLKDAKGATINDYRIAGGGGSGGTYVRLGNDGPVWEANAGLESLASANIVDWADKRLWPIDDEKTLVTFSIEAAGETPTRFSRESAVKDWKGQGSADAAKAGNEDVASLMRQVLHLDADSLSASDDAATKAKLQNQKRLFRVTLTAKASDQAQEQSYAIEIWQAANGQGDLTIVPLYKRTTIDGKPLIFTVSSVKIGDLKVHVSQPAAPAMGPVPGPGGKQ